FIFYIDPFINYYTKMGTKHSLKARAMYNDNQMTNDQSTNTTVIFTDYNFRKEYPFLNGFQFIGGLASQYTSSYAKMYGGSGSPNNNLLNVSGYAEFGNQILKIINFSAGIRFELYSLNNQQSETKSIFRLGASLKLLQETYLRMSYGQGYRYPTIAERFIKVSMGTFGVSDNPDLKPENSVNAEVGIKQGFKFLKYFGYLDIAVFQQDYNNTIEYLFGFWDSTYTFAFAGFKFLNTGKSRIIGIDISLTGKAQLSKNLTMNTIFGYNYIVPKALEPDYVFARDFNPGGDAEFSYRSTSIDPDKNILKYRFLHTLKADIEFEYKNFATGFSLKYFSKIENLDKAIADFEHVTSLAGGTIQPVKYMDYFYNHNNGNLIMDFRICYSFKERHKIALISNNLTNRRYSLRPLKAEPMRTIMLQYSLKI
ncbi:MAG: TonB-dependent receptor, partial [Bacteroidales bacterium]|nr:TonB-dependent receptor [Bacteroidales bacterium]